MKWISIKDRLPVTENSVYCLVRFKGGMLNRAIWNNTDYFWIEGFPFMKDITHWIEWEDIPQPKRTRKSMVSCSVCLLKVPRYTVTEIYIHSSDKNEPSKREFQCRLCFKFSLVGNESAHQISVIRNDNEMD